MIADYFNQQVKSKDNAVASVSKPPKPQQVSDNVPKVLDAIDESVSAVDEKARERINKDGMRIYEIIQNEGESAIKNGYYVSGSGMIAKENCQFNQNQKKQENDKKHAMEAMKDSTKALMARLDSLIEDLYKDLDDLADACDGLRFLRDWRDELFEGKIPEIDEDGSLADKAREAKVVAFETAKGKKIDRTNPDTLLFMLSVLEGQSLEQIAAINQKIDRGIKTIDANVDSLPPSLQENILNARQNIVDRRVAISDNNDIQLDQFSESVLEDEVETAWGDDIFSTFQAVTISDAPFKPK